MELSKLPKITHSGKKRVGRGLGSGKGGHTSGRGNKGQRARGKIALFFEGTKFKKSLIKRLPLVRGKGKFKSTQPKNIVVNVKYLNLFKENEEVTFASLQAKGIITKDLSPTTPVKILGEGELKIPLKVFLPVSGGARKKIEAAGGVIIGEEKTKTNSEKEKVSDTEKAKAAETKEKSTKTKTKKERSRQGA